MRRLIELICFILIVPFVAAGFACAYICAAWRIGVAEADRFGNRELDRYDRDRPAQRSSISSMPPPAPRIYRP